MNNGNDEVVSTHSETAFESFHIVHCRDSAGNLVKIFRASPDRHVLVLDIYKVRYDSGNNTVALRLKCIWLIGTYPSLNRFHLKNGKNGNRSESYFGPTVLKD